MILSPQAWGTMFVSKHHYAVELAKYGNTVYFLDPPEQTLQKEIVINPVDSTPGLFIIQHRINFPYNLKFHAISIFHWLMKKQVKKILKCIGRPIDIVWSFDLGNLYPFHLFPQEAFRIFHPVDEPLNETAIAAAKGAQVIFSVTNEILTRYKTYHLPMHFINHGVSELFLQQSVSEKMDQVTRVGFSGNLLRPDIDRTVFLQIINENPAIIFECWGSYQMKNANIGGSMNPETISFIQRLQGSANVKLHGAVSAAELSKDYRRMDAFLICYDIEKDQSSGTNYHKIMEYLSVGKVIISNNVSTYQDKPGLLEMITERTSNEKLPALFKKVIQNLPVYNSAALQQQRIDFANANTYRKQVETIEGYLKDECFVK